MSIDERLETTDFPLPAIRQVNMARHATGISLGLGELKGFPVDERVVEALKNSWQNGGACYTQNAGLPELRKAVAQRQKKQDGFDYTADHVVVTIGVQNAMYSTIKTLHKLGAKRVLIPEIYFGIYKKIPDDFGMEVLCYPLKSDFCIDADALDQLLLPDDILILNSPANPTGRVFTANEMTELASVLTPKLTDGYVISDEIYGSLVYEGEAFQSFSAFFERTIVVDGISKSGAVAGLRVGWAITRNATLAKAITSTNAVVISTPPTPNQLAALPIVNGQTQATIDGYHQVLLRNRNKVLAMLQRLGIGCNGPRGSFYIFPKIDFIEPDKLKAFCIEMAQAENGVVVIPGIAFGAANYIRISLASFELDEGLQRLERVLVSAK